VAEEGKTKRKSPSNLMISYYPPIRTVRGRWVKGGRGMQSGRCTDCSYRCLTLPAVLPNGGGREGKRKNIRIHIPYPYPSNQNRFRVFHTREPVPILWSLAPTWLSVSQPLDLSCTIGISSPNRSQDSALPGPQKLSSE
jgi:hypothetical protein